MVLELASAFVVSWGQIALLAVAVPSAGIAMIKTGDRLWGSGRKNGNGLHARVARLELHAENAGRTLGEIKDEMKTTNDRLFRILERKG